MEQISIHKTPIKLDWNEHINSVFKKSVLHAIISRKKPSKMSAKRALVRPILEYASCIGDKQTHIEKLEKIQKRAARFINGNRKFAHGNTSRIYSLLDWSPLQERRSKLKATMMFKSKNNLIEILKKIDWSQAPPHAVKSTSRSPILN